jgi:hypothetical protein
LVFTYLLGHRPSRFHFVHQSKHFVEFSLDEQVAEYSTTRRRMRSMPRAKSASHLLEPDKYRHACENKPTIDLAASRVTRVHSDR